MSDKKLCFSSPTEQLNLIRFKSSLFFSDKFSNLGIDLVIERKYLKSTIGTLLNVLLKKEQSKVNNQNNNVVSNQKNNINLRFYQHVQPLLT